MAQAGFDIRLGVKDEATVRRALQNLGTDGERSLGKLDKAARRAAKGGSKGKKAFDSLAASARVLEGPLGGVAGRMTAIGAAARVANPLLLATAAAIAASLVVLKKSVTAYEEFERRQLRTNALLQVTRQASGQTAEDLEDLAQSIGRGTLASASGVRDASAALLTFKSVSGDAFGRTLRLAQDLSAVFGQDLKAATVQLGKALEDPERNLSQLNRSGISFTQTTIDLVKNLKATGDEAGALDVILSNIEAQVGGAGAAEGGGLAGSWDNFNESLTGFLERTSEITRLGPAFAFALDNFYTPILDSTKPALLDARIQATRDRIVAIRNEIEADSKLSPVARDLGFTEEVEPRQSARLTRELDRFDEELAQQAARARARENAARAADTASRGRAAERVRAEAAKEAAKAEKTREAERVKARKAQAAADKAAQSALERREKTVAEMIANAEREVELARLSSAEKEIQLALDNARKAAGRDLTKQEEDRLVIATRQVKQIEATRQAESERIAANKREAERATGEIVDIGRDAIDSILDSGKTEDFFDNMVTLARRSFAQIASEALIRPIVQQVVFASTGAGGVPGGGGGGFGGGFNPLGILDFFSGGGSSGVTAGLGGGPGELVASQAGGASLGAAAGAAGLGFLAGSFLAKPLGLNPTGAALGAGAGAGIGFLVGGPPGALIGGGLGLLGGLFGPGKSSGPFSGSTVTLGRGRALAVSGGVDNGGEVAQGLQLGQAVADLARGIARLGGGRLGTGRVGIGFGGGEFFTAGDGTDAGGNRRAFGQDAGAAVVDAVKRLIAGGSIQGLDRLVERAVRRSLALNGDPDQVLADAGLAQNIADLRDGTTDLARGIQSLTRDFEDAALRARELGLPVAELTARLREQSADLADGFFQPLLDPLRSVRAGLTASSQSPGDRFAAAEAEARRLLSAAQGGDLSAIRTAPGAVALADQLGGQVFSAASPQLASLRGDLGAGLDSIIGTLEGDRASLERDFGLVFNDSIERQTKTLAGEIASLREVLTRQLESVAGAQRALPAAIKKVEKAVRQPAREPAFVDRFR